MVENVVSHDSTFAEYVSHVSYAFYGDSIASNINIFVDTSKANRVTALLMAEYTKVEGTIYVDVCQKLQSGVKPIILTDQLDHSQVTAFLLNYTNRGLYPMMMGPQTLAWFPAVLSRRAVPDWAPKGVELMANIMNNACFNSTGLADPTLCLIPMMAFFTYPKEFIDNKDLHNEAVRVHVGDIYGDEVKKWMEILAQALANNNWMDYVDMYNGVVRLNLLERHIGARFVDGLVLHTGEPTLSLIPMTQ